MFQAPRGGHRYQRAGIMGGGLCECRHGAMAMPALGLRTAGSTTMSTDQVFIGIALIFVLAVGSQVLASRMRIPALIVLLPAGFIAGTVTSDVNPMKLLGPAFEPVVSVAVAVILYDAGLGLDPGKLRGHTRTIVIRLIIFGTAFSFALAALSASTLLGMSARAAIMLGAILVVTGPTVVGPLLAFVRPAERLDQVLAWEGSLMDPIGGILGAAVFHGVSASANNGIGSQTGDFFAGLGSGLAGALIATTILWLLLAKLHLSDVLATSAQIAVVVAVAAGCDVVHTDSGLIAAIITGVAVSNVPGFNIPARRPFVTTLVELILGLLFVSIAATITPSSLRGLVLPTLGLVAVLVLIARPLTAAASTWRTDLSAGERGFVGWMAPRGIVAAATATTFSTDLVRKGVSGALKILPVTFLVIVATVAIYGLTAAPVARRLHVLRPARARPLLVGGQRWVIELAQTLRRAGLDVLMWATYKEQRQSIASAALPLAQGELTAWTSGQNAELEGITDVYLLTDEDDFNGLAAMLLHAGGGSEGPGIYQLAPPAGQESVVAPPPASELLFGSGLNHPAVAQRYGDGDAIASRAFDGTLRDDGDILFVIDSEGRLSPATQLETPSPRRGDTVIVLSRQA